jgi:predicted DNA-binding transcriptional regulator YafY
LPDRKKGPASTRAPGGPGLGPANQERLRFVYQTWDGNEARRLVEPHRLVTAGRRWYLVAYDVDRDDWRIFRVDRMREPQPTGQR